MNVLDLFSGIGGFSLGLEWAGMKTIAFCEKDKYCQKVLRKHWTDVPIFEDITTLKGETIDETIDLVCGGFPCQPFSVAGKRKGKEDNRHLWPEMFRIICETNPSWVIGENVFGIVNLELEQVCIDLEGEGYEVQPFIIPACSVNAPHRRDRVWIIAHSKGIGRKWGDRLEGKTSGKDGERIAVESERPNKTFNTLSDTTSERCNNRPDNRQERHILQDENGNAQEGKSTGEGRKCGIGEINTDAADTRYFRQEKPEIETMGSEQLCGNVTHSESRGTMPTKQQRQWDGIEQSNQDITDYASEGLEGANRRKSEHSERPRYNRNELWDENWIEVATHLCGVDVRIPSRLDRLKCLGNSVVPQIVEIIGRNIMEEESKKIISNKS